MATLRGLMVLILLARNPPVGVRTVFKRITFGLEPFLIRAVFTPGTRGTRPLGRPSLPDPVNEATVFSAFAWASGVN